ncbi:TerD family protein [Streptomyces sp. NPDC004752]
MLPAEPYRRDATWRLRAIGQRYADGLAGLARDFGVEMTVEMTDDDPAPLPPPPPRPLADPGPPPPAYPANPSPPPPRCALRVARPAGLLLGLDRFKRS